MMDDAKRMELLTQTLKSCGMFGGGADTLRVAKELIETEEKVRKDFEAKSEAMLDKMHENIKNRARMQEEAKRPQRKVTIIDKPKIEKPVEVENPLFDEAKTLHEIMKEDAEEVYENKIQTDVPTDIKEVEELTIEAPKEEQSQIMEFQELEVEEPIDSKVEEIEEPIAFEEPVNFEPVKHHIKSDSIVIRAEPIEQPTEVKIEEQHIHHKPLEVYEVHHEEYKEIQHHLKEEVHEKPKKACAEAEVDLASMFNVNK